MSKAHIAHSVIQVLLSYTDTMNNAVLVISKATSMNCLPFELNLIFTLSLYMIPKEPASN